MWDSILTGLLVGATTAFAANLEERQSDPCATLSGTPFTPPSNVRACFNSIPFNTTIRNNIVDVINKTMAFHASTVYQISTPGYTDVHVDIVKELGTIKGKTYSSDFALHTDVTNQVNRLLDGHAQYFNLCYDGLYVTYLPFPLVMTSDSAGVQDIRVAPEAYQVILSEFGQARVVEWETRAGFNFSQFNGAKVLALEGKWPTEVAEAAALVAGVHQAKTTRINSFFASYINTNAGWQYRMGDFAQKLLPPEKNTVTMQLQRLGQQQSQAVTVNVPYMSRFASTSIPFTNRDTHWQRNCLIRPGLNGQPYWPMNQAKMKRGASVIEEEPVVMKRQSQQGVPFWQSDVSATDSKRAVSAVIDRSNVENIPLPPHLVPTLTPAVNGGPVKFFKTGNLGVLVISSFSGGLAYDSWFSTLKTGIQTLKDQGATHLLIDVTNNDGGFVCVSHYLHRLLSGPGAKTEPQPGLDTKARWNPLASAMAATIVNGGVPVRGRLLYDPLRWKTASHAPLNPDANWLEPPVSTSISGRPDKFSQKLGAECGTWSVAPFTTIPFPMTNIVIMSNGRCGSACALFSVLMSKKQGVRTAVVSGQQSINQHYAGIVGGQSSSFVELDSEVKSTGWKNHPLAPPDFLTASYQGVVWRLAYGPGVEDPEEWRSHQADLTFQVGLNNISNPQAIWRDIAPKIWTGLKVV